MKKMKKIMSCLLIATVLMMNLALVPAAAEDMTGDQLKAASSDTKGAADDSGKAPAAKDGQKGSVEKPAASPEAATYKAEQTIELRCENTPAAEIYYTTDGTTEPVKDLSDPAIKKYDSAQKIKVTANTAVNPAKAATTTIKAIAYVGEDKSEVVEFKYTVDPNYTIAAPTASVASGTYKTTQTISLACTTPGVDIYYTTDGKTPDRDTKVGEKYDETKPIILDKSATLNVMAFGGDVKSELATYDYTIDPNFTVAAPTADPAAGTFASAQKVKLSSATDGAEIYYTTDGTTPDKSQKKYTAGETIEVAASMTVKAIAYVSDISSEVAEFEYVIDVPAAADKIDAVTVNGLTPAKRGEKPDKEAESAEPSKYTVEKVEWKDAKGKTVSGRFGANTAYYAYVTLKAAAGYEFDSSIFVQGDTCASVKVDGYSGTPLVSSYGKEAITVATGYKTSSTATANADDNKVTGVKSSYTKNSTVTFKAIGAGSTNGEVHGNERYIPTAYQVGSADPVDITGGKASVSGSYKASSAGSYKLKVTFQKQEYDADAGEWKDVADATDVKEVSYKVTSASGTRKTGTTARKTTTKTKTTSTKAKNAKTADETPVGAMAAVCLLAGASAAVMTVRRKKNS